MQTALNTHTHIVAVDPGLTGALAWLSCDPNLNEVTLHAVADVPTYLKKSGRTAKAHLDAMRLVEIASARPPRFRQDPSLAVIEEVGAAPGQGVTSMFRFGHTTGLITGVCAGVGMDIHLVRPQHWQKWARKRPGKNAAREHVADLFPEQKHLFKRVKDHGRADAVLIGYAYFAELLHAVPNTKG